MELYKPALMVADLLRGNVTYSVRRRTGADGITHLGEPRMPEISVKCTERTMNFFTGDADAW